MTVFFFFIQLFSRYSLVINSFSYKRNGRESDGECTKIKNFHFERCLKFCNGS